jgi:predicted HAD superfamily phosphohydrolase
MHRLLMARVDPKSDRKREDLGILADEIFGTVTAMRWGEMVDAIVKARGCSKNTAENRIKEMKKLEVIKLVVAGKYVRCPEGAQGTPKATFV